METKKLQIKEGQKAIWNYSRNHYSTEKMKERDGMVVKILTIYDNGFCSIAFSQNGITSAMLCELTPITI